MSKPDASTARLAGKADHWRDVYAYTDDGLATQVCADRIDILIDLDGHDHGNRLLCFARRPAPVQMTAIGYINTTGMAAMDYRLTDDWHDPVGMTEHLHTENLWRLPDGMWCYSPEGT